MLHRAHFVTKGGLQAFAAFARTLGRFIESCRSLRGGELKNAATVLMAAVSPKCMMLQRQQNSASLAQKNSVQYEPG